MKTGGTMNFLKRAGAILMLVAVFASSCNKYADDFKQINTKLDALAAAVAGVSTLTADNAALKAQVTALQTAVAALPTAASVTALQTGLASVTTTIGTINTNLSNLATSFATTGATKADVTAVITSMTTQLATLKAQLVTDNGTQTATLNASIAALQTSINALQTSLGTLSGTAATQASVDALKVQLAAAQVSLATLLANSNMFSGDVVISTDVEMTFWAKKIAQLGMINGNLTINTTNISAAKLDSLNLVVKNIGAIIGSQGLIKNSVNVISTSTSTLLDLSRLVSVAGDYTVSGVKVNDSNLSSVGGNFSVNYAGPYAYPNLTSVIGKLTLTRLATSISLPNVVVSGGVFDGISNGAGVLVYPEATSIILSGGVTSLTAAVATQITLGATDYLSGLIVSAPTAAAVVDLSAATKATGAVSVTTGNGGTVLFTNLASAAGAVSVTTGDGGTVLFTNLASAAGGVTVNTGTSGTVDFSKLATADGGISLTGPASVTFPLMTSGLLTSNATTVVLTKHDGVSAPVLAAVTDLTIGGLDVAGFNLANYNSTLLTASITAKSTSTVASVTSSTNTKLTSLALVGPMVGAVVDDQQKLTALTTSGVINSLVINSCDIITGVTLANTHLVGGTGSVLIVTNNPQLTSLKSSTDYPATITVTGNALLTSLDLSSYVTKLLAASSALTTITINTNKLSGNYTNAVAITPTTPYVPTTITSADLTKLKAFVATYPATAPPALVMAVDLDLVTLAGGTTTATLSSRMGADFATSPAFAAGASTKGIQTKAEMALVQ